MHLTLRDFRSFTALDWRLPSERLLLLGGNGAGKTSLLEAIYLAVTARSFRAARLDECARRGAASFWVRLASVGDAHRELHLGWSAERGRERALDGKTVRLGEQLATYPLLVWTEAESALVAGGPALRRRFFDRALVLERPAALATLGRYERALAAKRAALASGAAARELSAWNEVLAQEGSALAEARAELIAAAHEEAAEALREAGSRLPPVGLRYRPSPPAALAGAAALLAALESAAREERGCARPLVGAHRDEIELEWNGTSARRAASAGERKALGLTLLAALARRLAAGPRGAPALLLDDADTELDRRRLGEIVALFSGFPRLFVTSNRPEAWPAETGLERVAVEALTETVATTSAATS